MIHRPLAAVTFIGADIIALLQSIGGETMAKGMTTHTFVHVGTPNGWLERSLETPLVQRMASGNARAPILGAAIGG